ncbi:hypothetical protein F4703DRAFT_1795500 [Phycomyces blakesleeanus]
MARRWNIPEYKLLVTIDLGTNLSGYLLTHFKQEADINPITALPVARHWFGWRLIQEIQRLENNRDTEQISQDLLMLIRNLILADINIQYPFFDDRTRYRYALPAPASWSERAKLKIRSNAAAINLINHQDDPGRMMLIDETVAVAVFADHVFSGLNSPHLQSFMVCNAGTGLLSISVFEKETDEESETGTGSLKEITMETCVFWGSAFLDHYFEILVRLKASNLEDYKESDVTGTLDEFRRALKIFYENNCHDEDIMDLLRAVNERYTRGYKTTGDNDGFTLYEIGVYVFDPVIDQVVHTIEDHLKQLGDRNLSTMFTTGRLGESNYFMKRITQAFSNRFNHFESFGEETRPVMRGVSLFSANPKLVSQRIVRYSYGVKLGSPTVRPDGLPPVDEDRFYVCVKKGEAVGEDIWSSTEIPWNKKFLPIVSLYAYYDDGPIPDYPDAEKLDLVCISDYNSPRISPRAIKREMMAVKLCFRIDRVDVKVNYARGKDYKYDVVWDPVGERVTRRMVEINPPPSVTTWYMYRDAVSIYYSKIYSSSMALHPFIRITWPLVHLSLCIKLTVMRP